MNMNILRSLNLSQRALRLNYNIRNCSSAIPKYESQLLPEGEEIKITVPWGHISCVQWGPKDKQPILAFHGWQDNAMTWKRLIPLLNNDVSILAVDFPGHGKSSWYPSGMFYHTTDNLVIIRRIVTHFGWKSVSLLGHSMGAIASFIYGAHYPDLTNCLILLDNLKPMTKKQQNFLPRTSQALDSLLKVDKRNMDGSEPPSYLLDDLIERFYLGSHKSVDKDKCLILLERAIAKSSKNPEKYFFTRDSKLKYILNSKFDPDDVRTMASKLNMPVLNLKFKDGPYFEPVENYMEIVDLLKQNNKNFEVYNPPGTHHAHINNPEEIAPYINDFIQKHSL